MTWVRPDVIPASGLKSILSKDENFEFHINSGAPLSPGNWYHVAIVYDVSGTRCRSARTRAFPGDSLMA